jgi:hypothetical protein
MIENILIRPINNISDPNEESVLAILAHLFPVLEDWRAGEDFRMELEELNSSKTKFESEISTLKWQTKQVNDELQAFFKNFKSFPLPLLIGGLMVAIGGFLSSNLAEFPAGNIIGFAGILSIAGGVAKILKNKKKLAEELMQLTQTVNAKSAELTQINASIEGLKKELLSRVDTFPEVTQIRGAFPVSSKNILGKQMLLDESGLFPSTALETIDLSAIQSDLDSTVSQIELIRNVPVLLSPAKDSEGSDAINTLYGEENVIKNLVNEFTHALGQIKDVELILPLVPKDSFLANTYKDGNLTKGNYGVDQITPIIPSVVNVEEIDQFVEQVNSTKELGVKVFAELKSTFDSLQGICESYSFARSASINNVHEKLFEVLNKATWCSKRFYCPRTIQAPLYVEDLLNVHPLDAHKLSFDVLVSNLNSDPIVSARIKERQEITDQLYVHYQAIYDLKSDMDFDEEGNMIDIGERPAYITDQFQEALQRFRRTLSVIMTGSPNPILTFSKEAEMYYDPEVDEWRSDIIPYVYNTASMMRYGQVLKVTSDLMIPLWEHLWTEKADFRKSELFRTNESIILMTEKESEKLIEVGNQFKADMRTVRENVYLLESELSSKYDELIAFRDGMESLGLLSERQKLFLTDEKLKEISVGERSVLEEGDDYETLLGLEPRVQAERRGTVGDPIDFVRSPDILISYKGSASKRLASS